MACKKMKYPTSEEIYNENYGVRKKGNPHLKIAPKGKFNLGAVYTNIAKRGKQNKGA